MSNESLLEELADSEHDKWSRWMRWMLINWTKGNVERWWRQKDTPYSELTEREKESDRKEARKTLEIIREELGG